MKKKATTTIGILISGVFLYIALKGVSFDELIGALKQCNYLYLIPAFIVMYLLFVIRTMRWYYLVKPLKETSFNHRFSATIIGFMTNNILPVRIGEFVRAYVLGADEGIKKSSVFGTIVIERLFDGMSLLLILLVTFLAVDLEARLPAEVAANLKIAGYVALALYAAIIVFIITYNVTSKYLFKFLAIFSDKFSDNIATHLNSFKAGLTLDTSFKNIAIISFYSILHWIFCALPIYIVIKGFGLNLPIEVAFVVLIFKAFAVMIPAAPGYIGTVNIAVMVALALYGVPERPDGVSISFVVWAVDFLPPVVLGFIMLWAKNMSLKGVEESAQAEKMEG